PGDVTIGDFLRSVSSWRRGASPVEVSSEPEAPRGSQDDASDAVGEAELPEPAVADEADNVDVELVETSIEVVAGWQFADSAFDSALGYSPSETTASEQLPEALAPEQSGSDDLGLLDVDDLFPWELPVPESSSVPVSPVEPAAIDSDYPFDHLSGD